MKIALLTAYTEFNPWTKQNRCDYFDVARDNHTEYCYKMNYSYIAECYNRSEYEGMNPTWVKILALKKFLPLFDYVAWIDSDAVITNLDKPIESFLLNPDVDLVIPKSPLDKRTGTCHTAVSTGFMVMKNCDWSLKFLDRLINEAENFILDDFHEQTVLNKVLKEDGYFDKSNILFEASSEKLEYIYESKNLSVLPCRYQVVYEDDPMLFIYHAGGDSPNKGSKLKSVLEKNLNS